MILFFDFETTGLIRAAIAPLSKQPRAIELCIVGLESVAGEPEVLINTLVNPGQPISAEITRITGIKQEELVGKPTWPDVWPQVKGLLDTGRQLVGHNAIFDYDILDFEVRRMGEELKAPPLLCTIEATRCIAGYRLNLNRLHKILFGSEVVGAHRAEADTVALANCYKEMVKKGWLPCPIG